MAETGLPSGPDAQPPETEAVSDLPPSSGTIESAGMRRLGQMSEFITSMRSFFGNDRGRTNFPAPRSSRTGGLIYGRFRSSREGPQMPNTPYERNQPRAVPIERPINEEQVRQELTMLNVNGLPVAFNFSSPGALDISSPQSVLSYMRKWNIPPDSYRATVTNLQRAAASLGQVLQTRPEFAGATLVSDGARIWATNGTRSVFASATQVCFVDGPPRANAGSMRVQTADGASVSWTLTAAGGSVFEGNGRRITERLTTGTSAIDIMMQGGRVASSAYFASEGAMVARANFANAPLPDPRNMNGVRANGNLTRASDAGIFLYLPDRSRYPAVYQQIVQQNGGWLPPPRLLLSNRYPPPNQADKERTLLDFAASLPLPTSNAWLTGIFAGTQEQEPWNLMASNLRFHRGAYRGIDGLRAGTGACMQVADLGVQILRRRGLNPIILRVEHDHTAAVALQPVAGGVQAVLYDSMGVHYREPQVSPVAALLTAWQDDRHPRPAQAQFIDDRMDLGTIDYNTLAARMMGAGAAPRG